MNEITGDWFCHVQECPCHTTTQKKECDERVVSWDGPVERCGGEYIKVCDIGKHADFKSLYQCDGCKKIKLI